MNPGDPNVVSVQLVAEALGDLRLQLMLVGGSSVGLLMSDPARPPVRATQDVDLVAKVLCLGDYYNVLCPALRERGFKESVDGGDHMLRWKRGTLIVDILPTEELFKHSVNRWYPEAMSRAQPMTLPNGLEILVVTAPLFIATKLEAFADRGGGDYTHHDMEDIITLVDGRPELVEEVLAVGPPVSDFIRDEIDGLLADATFVDQLPMHFRTDPVDQQRVAVVVERLKKLAGL